MCLYRRYWATRVRTATSLHVGSIGHVCLPIKVERNNITASLHQYAVYLIVSISLLKLNLLRLIQLLCNWYTCKMRIYLLLWRSSLRHLLILCRNSWRWCLAIYLPCSWWRCISSCWIIWLMLDYCRCGTMLRLLMWSKRCWKDCKMVVHCRKKFG